MAYAANWVHPELLLTPDQVEKDVARPDWVVVDCRDLKDYAKGHIPGAISAPYLDNLNSDGTFRSGEELRERFTALLGDTPAAHTAFYCGSGVNATQNILALQHVGLGDAKLYAGSWSEWITDPNRPIAK